MAAITSTTESWNSHKFSEVESHIKGSYFKTVGGTLTNNVSEVLSINSTRADAHVPAIGFYYNGTRYGGICMTDSNALCRFNNDFSSTYTILDSSNSAHTHSYLPLTGGTLTGALTINPTNASSYQDGIILNDKGTGAAEALTIKWTSASYTTGVKLAADLNGKQLMIHDGTSWFTILNTGNSSHTHSDYSLTSHSHSNYSLTSHTHSYYCGNIAVSTSSSNLTIPCVKYVSFRNTDNNGNAGFVGRASDSTNALYFENSTNNPIYFATSASTRMTILGGGNVGIGTTSPSQKLTVNGQISAKGTFTLFDSNNNDFTIYWRESNDTVDLYSYETNYHNMCLGSASSSISSGGLYWKASTGCWGIGTDSPTTKLQVNGLITSYHNSRTLTIGAQNSTGIHFYNDNNCSFFFNGSVSSNASQTYDLGSTSYPWKTLYLGAGCYLTTKATYLDIVTTGNELCLGATSSSDLHINYRTSNGTYTAKKYLWKGGSSSTWASHEMGNLTVNGDISATGGITSLSDERMKNIIGNTELTLEQIANAPAVKFTWKNNQEEGEQVGTIAQYWQKVLPEVVLEGSDEEKTLSFNYGVAALVSSITTARKVVDHEKEIKALKAKINVLEERISELEG